MANVEFSLSGWEEITKRLKALPKRLQRQGLRTAARQAMNIVRDTARANAPVKTGFLKKNIITRINTKRSRQVGGVVAQVGIRGGSKKYVNNKQNRRLGRVGDNYEHGDNAYYWRFVEFGTINIRPRPFMRPALTQNITAVTNKMAEAIRLELDKVA